VARRSGRVAFQIGANAIVLGLDDAQKVANVVAGDGGSQFAQALAKELAVAARSSQRANAISGVSPPISAGVGLSEAEVQKIVAKLAGGGIAAMALAIMINEAISEARASDQPAHVGLSRAQQSRIATALDQARALCPELARLRRRFTRPRRKRS
jgi:hypothetical protein